MSEGVRLFVQLAGNIIGAGFAVVMGFSQLADFFSDRSHRHLLAALAWFVLAFVFILRTAGVPDPKLLDPQFIADWTAIGWACAELLGVAWAVWRLLEKRAEWAARHRLGLNAKPEKEIGP